MIKPAADAHFDVLSSGTSRWTPKCRRLSEVSGGSGQPPLFLHDAVAGAFHGVSVSLEAASCWMEAENIDNDSGSRRSWLPTVGMKACYCQCGKDIEVCLALRAY